MLAGLHFQNHPRLMQNKAIGKISKEENNKERGSERRLKFMYWATSYQA